MTLIEGLNSCFDFVDKIDKNDLFSAIILFTSLMYLWENYLSYRQVTYFFKNISNFFVYSFFSKTFKYCVEKRNSKVPNELQKVTDQETFDKSRSYAQDKRAYGFVSGFYNQIESMVKSK